MKLFSSFLFVILFSCAVHADAFDPPATYYDTATGTGAILQAQLHDIIDNHISFSYGDARASLQVTDADPNNADHIILVYDRVSLDVSGLFASGIPGWDSGVSWNREHTWPRARGVNSSGPDNSDLHQLRPSTPGVNSNRGSLNFGGAFGQPFGIVNDGGTKWYPGDADAGTIARQQFYMETRYTGDEGDTVNLTLVTGNPNIGGTTLGDLDRLLEWHYLATPDDFERNRNQVIFDSYQQNRNPFIDRPQFVWSVFVDQNNDTQLSVGGAINADGSSSVNADLGTIIVGGSINPAATTDVTLNKTGNDGTYYEVTVAGDATSSVEGRFNAFGIGSSDSEMVTVGYVGGVNTGAAGFYGDTVTIDNLDITTDAGLGMGGQDNDDTINVGYTVLDHSNASFNVSVDDNTLTLDFGTVTAGASANLGFDVFNLEALAGFTADLELSTFAFNSGDDVFSSDFAPTTLSPGDSAGLVAAMDTSTVGDFSGEYRITSADEALSGATAGADLLLTLMGTVTNPLLGDANNDGQVTGADLIAVQQNFGNTGPPNDGTLLGDANDDGQVTGADLISVQQNFGNVAAPTSAVVPEPATLTLLGLGGLVLLSRRRG